MCTQQINILILKNPVRLLTIWAARADISALDHIIQVRGLEL